MQVVPLRGDECSLADASAARPKAALRHDLSLTSAVPEVSSSRLSLFYTSVGSNNTSRFAEIRNRNGRLRETILCSLAAR